MACSKEERERESERSVCKYDTAGGERERGETETIGTGGRRRERG